MIVIRSQQVIDMRELHLQEPEFYPLIKTSQAWCGCAECLCTNGIEVLASKVEHTIWTCSACLVLH